MSVEGLLLVTGASGQLGRRVLALLLEQAAGPIVATTRNPAALADFAARGVIVRRADFDDPASLTAAAAGVERALLISTDALDRPGQRLEQQRQAVQALQAAGVRHVVYTSMPKPEGSPITIAPDHAGTERALAESTLDFTVLRNNIYSDMLLLSLPAAIAAGQLVDAKQTGAVAYVTRDDCARAAAAALADRQRHGRTVIDITGPQAITSAQLASLAGELAARPVVHVDLPPAQLVEGLAAHGVPRVMAEVLASFDIGSARGALATISNGVQQLTGRPPRPLADFLAEHRPQLLAALR